MLEPPKDSFNAFAGIAHIESRRVWVDAGPPAPFTIEEQTHNRLETLAHEIGHIMIGRGHPNTDGGPSPLPGTTHKDRLMHSGVNLDAVPVDGHLLVKGEWDKIDAWLVEVVDN